MALSAHRHLQRIQRAAAHRAELPLTQLLALTANLNRDPNKGKPSAAMEWAIFQDRKAEEDGKLQPEVAAVALALRSERKGPPLMLAVWTEILAAAETATPLPETQALVSDDGVVWVLAPRWEGRNIRAGLICVGAVIHGPVTLRDYHRPLLSYEVTMPNRRSASWVDNDYLLVAAGRG